jgi:hypothetical protein
MYRNKNDKQTLTHAEEVQTTWKNRDSNKPFKKDWPEPTRHRNRDEKPNKLPYKPGHSDFYNLPYITRDELKKERRKAEKNAPLPSIKEETNTEIQNDSSDEIHQKIARSKRFMRFDGKETIDKNHIIGIHSKKDHRYDTEYSKTLLPDNPVYTKGPNSLFFGSSQESSDKSTRHRKSRSDNNFLIESAMSRTKGMRKTQSFTDGLNELDNSNQKQPQNLSQVEKLENSRSCSNMPSKPTLVR